VPDRTQPEWVRNAKSRVVLQGTGQWLMSMLPDDPESTILRRLKRPKGDEPDPQQPQQPQPPEQRSDDRRATPEGYDRSDTAQMQRLIDQRTGAR
jgi:membrane protein required for colicin V production